MWIPTPIYERIPQFWLLLGLLFMSSGTYLGFEYSLSFVYFGVGFACCLWSLWIFTMRLRSRQAPQQQVEHTEHTEQTEHVEHQSSTDLNQGPEPVA